MLEFVTLFLGLSWNLQPVELIVADPAIVRLEIRLDGETRARLEQPPWRAEVDFGELRPHRLEAFGFDAGGKILARVEQWINLPRSQAEARLVVESDDQGRKTHARLTWESTRGAEPAVVDIRLDGDKLAVADPHHFALPELDLTQLHFLTAELTFPDAASAHAEAVFGGRYGAEVETELTAYPVRLLDKKADRASLHGCFTDSEGQPLRVAEIDREPVDLLFVRDRGAEPVLQQLRELGSYTPGVQYRSLRSRPLSAPDLLRFEMKLEAPDRVNFVWPNLLPDTHRQLPNMGLFKRSPMLTPKDGGIFFFLTRVYPPEGEGRQHLADAVALAGLCASAEGRRRAVVLFLGEEAPEEHSVHSAARVRSFLDSLGVPLFVWSGAKTKEAGSVWPAAQSVLTPAHLEKAYRKLKKELDQQLIVWLTGRHLAAQVQFDAAKCPGFAPLVAPLQGMK